MAPAATFLHRQPCCSNYHSCPGDHFPAETATSPAMATTFLQQKSPFRTSNYQFCTSSYQPCSSDHIPTAAITFLHQQLLVLPLRPPSCISDHLLHQPLTVQLQRLPSCPSDLLSAPATTSPELATTFLHQQIPVLH